MQEDESTPLIHTFTLGPHEPILASPPPRLSMLFSRLAFLHLLLSQASGTVLALTLFPRLNPNITHHSSRISTAAIPEHCHNTRGFEALDDINNITCFNSSWTTDEHERRRNYLCNYANQTTLTLLDTHGIESTTPCQPSYSKILIGYASYLAATGLLMSLPCVVSELQRASNMRVVVYCSFILFSAAFIDNGAIVPCVALSQQAAYCPPETQTLLETLPAGNGWPAYFVSDTVALGTQALLALFFIASIAAEIVSKCTERCFSPPETDITKSTLECTICLQGFNSLFQPYVLTDTSSKQPIRNTALFHAHCITTWKDERDSRGMPLAHPVTRQDVNSMRRVVL